ncbi:hypothetical protein ACJMK2_039041 [Sinanodonta woodiana]|uniref:RING-type domain-containing protein n=1 Tax=Sinanodonta woodiana TaxID=1069815 RepID=A0ABD3WAX7_SINWO
MTTATIADELTCPVCLELYKDPRVLPCQHSLCKSCLVALHSKKDKDSNCDIQCPSCRYIFNATNETHIDAWPHNFTLASIVSKLQASLKDNVFLCDLCDEDQKRRAIKKCMQCQLQYCKVCVEQLHPKRGALANHKLVHIVDSVEEEHKLEEPTSAILSPGSEKSVSFLKYDQLVQHRYCLSCDVMFTKGDQMTAEGSHELHDTTEIHTAFRRKREEFHRTRGRLLDEDMELEKAMASITNQIQTIKKCVEDKKTELLHIFGEVAEEMERTQIAAENKIEEQMKIRVNSLESRLHELEDHKKKTQVKLTSLSELSSLTNEDASIFFMKLKKLQNAIEPVTEDYIQPELKGTGCDSSLPIEQFMNELIANVARDICTSQKRLHAPASTMADTDISSQHASLAIKVTNVQKEGKMCADVEWVAMDQVDHYEISYSCDPSETVLKRNIMENRCKLTSLRWDCEYTITVTAYMPDGKTSFDSRVFKTDLKVKETSPAMPDILPNHTYFGINVTNDQNEGTMSADVEWWRVPKAGCYEVSYHCNSGETVVLKTATERRCRLTHLRWNSTYTIKVKAQLQDGNSVFNEHIFSTDPQVKCYPMVVSKICNKQVSMPDSFNEFIASNIFKNWEDFHKVGDFSGVVFTPVLTEEKHFWTMNITLTIFEKGSTQDDFLDFGIVNYAAIEQSTGLTSNDEAYSCCIATSRRGDFILKFESVCCIEGRQYHLPLQLYKESKFCYGFMYDQVNRQFAVMDCLERKVLHVFTSVTFEDNQPPIFAVCPYHDKVKMRVEVKLDYMHYSKENVSYWIRKINAF